MKAKGLLPAQPIRFDANMMHDSEEKPKTVRIHWLPSILGALGVLLLAAPAEAGKLQSWQYNSDRNQLVFTTDEGVQPRVQLVPNPTRLVIDLPGTRLARPRVNQTFGGAVQAVRVGQFDAETTRIVIELDPRYTVDPQQVRVRGASPTEWSVQLPTPQRLEAGSSSVATGSSSAANAATRLEGLRVTPDGFFLQTSGAVPEIEQSSSDDRRQVMLTLKNTALSSQVDQREIEVERYGVEQIRLEQTSGSPPAVRVTLNLSNSNTEWRASATNLGGVVLVPGGGASLANRQSQSLTARQPDSNRPATVQAVELSEDGSQLLIRSDRRISRYSSGWDRASTAYQITLTGVRLAPEAKPPQLGSRSPLVRITLQQQAADTVVIRAFPTAGVRFGDIEAADRLLSLSLGNSGRRAATLPPLTRPPRTSAPTGPLPSVRNGRIVVALDPGHGGRDPGAVGRNNLQEADIVLPIAQQVANLLERQGVQAVLTRQDDSEIDLEPRVQTARRANADLFVSIHANSLSLSRPDVNGYETYYYTDSGLRLARVIHSAVLQTTGSFDRGIHKARFYVLRRTSMPAVLLEIGFVTGAQDAERLSDPQYRNLLAEGIARGILQYIQQNF